MANEKFLDAFRALDTELRLDGCSVLDYENSLDEMSRERLKVCRIMRNYMAHNDTTFLTTTTDQIRFLENQTLNIRRKSHTVADEMMKLKPIKSTAPIKEVVAALAKHPLAVIEVPKVGLYLVDKDILVKNLAAGNKKIAIPAKLPGLVYISKDERVKGPNSFIKGVFVVTSDGTSEGKYLGVAII